MNFVSLYCSLSGRINRRIFWLAHLPYIALSVILNLTFEKYEINELVVCFVNGLILCLTIPLLVKRWHDLDKSAWYLLTYPIPIINIISFVELGFAPGDKESNRYGEPRIAT